MITETLGLDISIHALREEGDCGCFRFQGEYQISIHALREEGDRVSFLKTSRRSDISIHALREEGDRSACNHDCVFLIFLSTPSARRATYNEYNRPVGYWIISIHALREEGDPSSRDRLEV